MPKGDHFSGCEWNYPDCICLKCANDGESDSRGRFCCEKHRRYCDETPCKHFKAEEEEQDE